jgi:hypothetical protein
LSRCAPGYIGLAVYEFLFSASSRGKQANFAHEGITYSVHLWAKWTHAAARTGEIDKLKRERLAACRVGRSVLDIRHLDAPPTL